MDLGESAGGLPPDEVVERTEAILSSTEAVAARLHDGDRISVVVAPCSPFTVTTELMVESAALARRLGLRLHTHLAETIEEERDCLARLGRRPVDFVEELGWLERDVWFAHAVHLDASEVARFGRAGAGVAHCPSSNARLAAGLCPVRDLVDAGAPVGLGVDGAASNEGGTLQPELKQALYLARLRAGRPDAMSPAQVLELGTSGGAECLGPARSRAPRWWAPRPTSPSGRRTTSTTSPTPSPASCSGRARSVRHLLVGGDEVVVDGALAGRRPAGRPRRARPPRPHALGLSPAAPRGSGRRPPRARASHGAGDHVRDELAALDHPLTADPDTLDADRHLAGRLERRPVGDREWIEQDQIRRQSGPDLAESALPADDGGGL